MTPQELVSLLNDQTNKSELDQLEDRELELFSFMSQGNSKAMICEEMALDAEALGWLKKSIQKKLGLKNETELQKFATMHRA